MHTSPLFITLYLLIKGEPMPTIEPLENEHKGSFTLYIIIDQSYKMPVLWIY